MIRNKTIKFNMNNPSERNLWDYLQTLAHGQFSEEVKEYFLNKMITDKRWLKMKEEEKKLPKDALFAARSRN